MKKNLFFFFTGIFLSFLIFLGPGVPMFKSPTTAVFNKDNIPYSELQNILDTYLPKPSNNIVQNHLISGFVNSYGNRFTTYFPPDEVLAFQTMIQGDFEGIGAYIENNASDVYIRGVLPGSPAQEAWLLPWDLVQKVDGEVLYGKTAEYAVKKIRWPAGTSVVIQIFSTVLGTKKDVTLIRRHLELPIMEDRLEGDILHIKLFSFNDYSGQDVQKSLKKYAGKYKKILLDLRENGGGTLQAAVDVGSIFLKKGSIIASVEGKDNKQYTSYGEKNTTTPLYILVNANTASASEILASALNFYLKAPIIGSQTYGKWSVQELFELSNGGQLKVTTAHWRTAGGQLLDGVGIIPDFIIIPTARDITEWTDNQEKEALKIVKNAIPTQK